MFNKYLKNLIIASIFSFALISCGKNSSDPISAGSGGGQKKVTIYFTKAKSGGS